MSNRDNYIIYRDIYKNPNYYDDKISMNSIKYTGNINDETRLSGFTSRQLDEIIDFLSYRRNIDLSLFSSKQILDLIALLDRYNIKLPINQMATPKINIPIQQNIIQKQQYKTANEIREEKEKETIKALNNRFFNEICNKNGSESFRGWILPNGRLLSQYNESTDGNKNRQDHTKLVELFMSGLELYNIEKYNFLKDLYDDYVEKTHSFDSFESFAVERLGWIQLSVFGMKKLMYRAERWQDKLVRPYLVDYGFNYSVANSGKCYLLEFEDLYDNVEDIIKLGLEKKASRNLIA